MVRRYNRLLVAFYVVSDALLGMSAFVLAYVLRFDTGLIPSHRRATRRSRSTSTLLPFIAVLVPLAFQLQGIYRLRRGRSRVDDFFAVFVGSILAVVLGIVATLYVQAYFADRRRQGRAAPSRCRSWSGRIFLVLNVVAHLRLARAGARAARAALARRHRPQARS